MVSLKALYSLNCVVNLFWAHNAKCMQELGYELCKADPLLWMKPETRPEDKFEYYSYILCYVDDILCIHHDPDDVSNKLNHCVQLKQGTKLK